MSENTFCNSCFEDKEDTTKTFFCTSCSHVFCSTCLSNFENFCLLCKVKCKVLEINDDLPAEVKMIFEENYIEKNMNNVKKAFNFQKNQSRLYTEKLKVNVKKYQDVKKDILRFKQYKTATAKIIEIEKANIVKLKAAYK